MDGASVRRSFDHYICAAHMRGWATGNRVTVLRREMRTPETLDVGKRIAAERGLNDPLVEAGYGKVESSFSRALPRLLDLSREPSERDWQAVREYAVLVHDRFPGLRGSARDEHGLPGGNAIMVPNPDHWGASIGVSDSLARLATMMDREEMKAARLQLLPPIARLLPRMTQILNVGPMLLGDAGVHAIALHTERQRSRTYVAMPLSPRAMAVFGNQRVGDEEGLNLARILNMKIAMESTVVIDTLEAPIITGFVTGMWSHQHKPSGWGVPTTLHVWNQVQDIPNTRSNSAP